jgi:hypothetical protein
LANGLWEVLGEPLADLWLVPCEGGWIGIQKPQEAFRPDSSGRGGFTAVKECEKQVPGTDGRVGVLVAEYPPIVAMQAREADRD